MYYYIYRVNTEHIELNNNTECTGKVYYMLLYILFHLFLYDILINNIVLINTLIKFTLIN